MALEPLDDESFCLSNTAQGVKDTGNEVGWVFGDATLAIEEEEYEGGTTEAGTDGGLTRGGTDENTAGAGAERVMAMSSTRYGEGETAKSGTKNAQSGSDENAPTFEVSKDAEADEMEEDEAEEGAEVAWVRSSTSKHEDGT